MRWQLPQYNVSCGSSSSCQMRPIQMLTASCSLQELTAEDLPWQEQSVHKRRGVTHHSRFSSFPSGKMPTEVLDLPRQELPLRNCKRQPAGPRPKLSLPLGISGRHLGQLLGSRHFLSLSSVLQPSGQARRG